MGKDRNKSHILYLIDFGLSKKYLNKDSSHIEFVDGKDFVGTAKFGSINTHRGIEQSRRDDLESFVYCVYYFLKGRVPWDGVQANTKKEKYNMIMELKLLFQQELTTLEQGLYSIYEYVRKLGFNETPDYSFIKSKLTEIAAEKGISLDFSYDWHIMSQENTDNNEVSSTSLSPEKKGGLKITFGKNKFLNTK